MHCTVCSEEIPDDSLFCPECGARQDPSKSMAMGGRNFGVVSGQAVQATRDMQDADAAGATFSGSLPIGSAGDNVLSKIATQMDGQPSPNPAPAPQNPAPVHEPQSQEDQGYSQTDQIVDRIVDNERQDKEGARKEWLAMNQKTASGVLSSLTGSELPEHLDSGGGARFLDDAEDISREKKRVKSNQPSPSLLRRMAEVAVRRVARKRGVAVESPQVALTEDETIRVNVTYIDDGRVLDTPPDLSNAFEHAISTELALKGFDIGIEIVLFRSMDGKIEAVWGDVGKDEEVPEDDEDLFSCEDCGHYPIKESDPSCPSCGAAFLDDGDDDYEEQQPAALRGPTAAPSGGPPSRGPGGGGPPRGPSRAPSSSPKGPSRGGPPSQGPGGGGPPSSGPGGGPPSKGPSGGGPPSRGPSGGGPPSKGPSGGPPRGGGPKGPKGGPSGGPKGGPPGKKGPGGPRRGGPPR